MKTPAPANYRPSGGQSLLQKVSNLNKWRDSLNPLRGLTLPRAVHMAEAYYRGEMADLQWAYFFLEQTDPDLLALIELRVGRVLQMDFHVKIAKGADEQTGKAQAQLLRERFDKIDNFYEAIEHLAMASFRGFAHCEKWIEGGDLVHLEVVDQWNCVRDGLRGRWKYNPEARNVGYRGLPDSQLMPADQFLYRQVARPINRVALFKFIRSNLVEKDWDAFVEIYGIPGGVLIGPPGITNETQKAEFEAAANEIARGGSGYAPNGSDWKPNTAARDTQPFKERAEFLSEKLVLAGTGGRLTMLNGPTGLGSGQSDLHGEVFATIAAADARKISEVINRQIVQPWLDEAFPGLDRLAYFELAANQPCDVGAIIDDIKGLADAGYQVDVGQARELTGYRLDLKQPNARDNLPAVSPVMPWPNRGAPKMMLRGGHPISPIRY